MGDLGKLSQRLDELERSQVELKDSLRKAEEARDAYHHLYMEMMERCRKLERGLMGPSSERLPKDDDQLSLKIIDLALDERDKAEVSKLETEEVKSHKRRKPTGRKPIADVLPRVDIEILPDEVRREGLAHFDRIGEDVAEVIERRPASLVIARVIKPKFVRKDRDRQSTKVYVGATPGLPIERGVAGPGLLADTLVRRWQDHLPLNRLESIYARDRLEVARSTICGWHMQLVPLVEPLVAAMRADAFTGAFHLHRRDGRSGAGQGEVPACSFLGIGRARQARAL